MQQFQDLASFANGSLSQEGAPVAIGPNEMFPGLVDLQPDVTQRISTVGNVTISSFNGVSVSMFRELLESKRPSTYPLNDRWPRFKNLEIGTFFFSPEGILLLKVAKKLSYGFGDREAFRTPRNFRTQPVSSLLTIGSSFRTFPLVETSGGQATCSSDPAVGEFVQGQGLAAIEREPETSVQINIVNRGKSKTKVKAGGKKRGKKKSK